MKLQIEKIANLKVVRVKLTTDSSKKPLMFDLNEPQIKSLTGLIDTALNSTEFLFSIEL